MIIKIIKDCHLLQPKSCTSKRVRIPAENKTNKRTKNSNQQINILIRIAQSKTENKIFLSDVKKLLKKNSIKAKGATKKNVIIITKPIPKNLVPQVIKLADMVKLNIRHCSINQDVHWGIEAAKDQPKTP